MIKKKILYIDMDGVIADFEKAIVSYCPDIYTKGYDVETRSKMVDDICETNTDIFHSLEPMAGALEAIHELNEVYDIYFLSTPMWNVPESFTGKRIWIEKYFPEIGKKKLILTHRKDLNVGDFLVDDRIKHGVDKFSGIHIHYGTEDYPNWKITKDYLMARAN